jgi:hypothetical protein
MRSSPHPPSPLLPHGEQGEPPQIPLPDAVRSPSPAQGFMGGQNMGSTHGVFCVLTRWNALTPSLRATPLPRAGERNRG